MLVSADAYKLTRFVPHRFVLYRFARGSARAVRIIAPRFATIRYILLRKIIAHLLRATSCWVRASHSRGALRKIRKKKVTLLMTLNNNLGRRFGDSCTCMIIRACQFCYMSRRKINISLQFIDFSI